MGHLKLNLILPLIQNWNDQIDRHFLEDLSSCQKYTSRWDRYQDNYKQIYKKIFEIIV